MSRCAETCLQRLWGTDPTVGKTEEVDPKHRKGECVLTILVVPVRGEAMGSEWTMDLLKRSQRQCRYRSPFTEM